MLHSLDNRAPCFRVYEPHWPRYSRLDCVATIHGAPSTAASFVAAGAERSPMVGGPEQWRTIPGFPGYEVSDAGRVRSFMRQLPRILHQYNCRGYRQVAVRRNSRTSRRMTVHQLVLMAFVGPRSEGGECRHLDNNRANNHLSNLRWGTKSDNMRDRARRYPGVFWGSGERACGERNGAAKLSSLEVEQIRRLHGKLSQRVIAKQFGVSKSNIGRILRREGWVDRSPR